MSDRLERAHATLRRGALFLGSGLRTQGSAAPLPIDGRYRAKVIGNGLRELDRFLNLLLDEAALASGLPASPGQRNTANKLRRFRAAADGGEDADLIRLRALGRARDCLFYNNGIVARGDVRGGATMSAPWRGAGPDQSLHSVSVGEALVLTPADLAGICAFYEALGNEVSARAAAAPARSDQPERHHTV